MTISPADFDFMADLLKKQSGLIITKDKVYLLESRLLPLARRQGLPGLNELIALVRGGKDATIAKAVNEAMTTNESFFFRDVKPFQLFETETLPHLLKTRAAQKSFRIWSAAASNGQEPYTLAMILKQHEAKMKDWKIEIIGTDLSNEVLAKAKSGIYSQFEVQRGLPIQYLMKYFTKTNEAWQINEAIRNMVQYKPLNLLQPFNMLGTMDVIFCRNVLIYFDQPTKAEVLGRMAKQLTKDGVLYLGGAETVVGVTERFKPVAGQRGIYALAA
jgi:chemotaxis protein methyltransferase CheR